MSRNLILIASGLFFFFMQAYPNSDKILNETAVRDGLPNVINKLKNNDSISVAYLGGSITAQNGWRVYSFNWLKKEFPDAVFTEINATIGGTGSDLGVFRLKDQVLRFRPDMILIEFAVNDSKKDRVTILRSMEGIVRQIWQNDPQTDICFVYTLKEDLMPVLLKNEQFESMAVMEEIAAAYGIPSINFAPEVCRMVQRGELIIKGREQDIDGITVFSPDGVHPYPETGHVIYNNVFRRAFAKITAETNSREFKHKIPEPLAANNYEKAHLENVRIPRKSKSWQILKTSDSEFSSFSKAFESLAFCDANGESLKMTFEGTDIGAYDLMGPGAGRVIVSIDGEVKDTIYRFDAYCTYWRMNYFLINDLVPGRHEVVFTVLSEPFDKSLILSKNGNTIDNPARYGNYGWHIGKLMINGKLIR